MKWSKEDLEQVAFVNWLNIKKRQHKIISFFSIQNENKMSWSIKNKKIVFAIAQKDRQMGKKKGVSDMCVVLKNTVLFVELKQKPKILKTKTSIAGIKVSQEQLEFLDEVCNSSVVNGTVAFGSTQAISFVSKYIE